MGKLYILMGKSASGKDTLYQYLTEDEELGLKRVIGYTTRPLRTGEQNGREYWFVDQEERTRLEENGRVIETRVYHTVYGDWYYFTADDGQVDMENGDYLMLGTLETYLSIRDYYGEDRVVPLYLEVEDGERLKRAIAREEQSGSPKYAEMCRDFLADAKDFSEENLKEAGIVRRYQNESVGECYAVLKREILNSRRPGQPEL